MYRLYAAITVFATVLAVGIGGFIINTRAAADLSAALNDAYSLAQSGDLNGSKKKMSEAVRYMDKYSAFLCVFVSHKIIDDIRQETDKAQVYLTQGERELFLASCRCAIFRTEDFRSLEYPTLSNIL
ncbi:MAG: DUF4363 family protein [Clostridia bacterium]|nr:DUF4363 family protein [Clostridia bacterium]